jgi:hypothetical protein
MTAGNVIHRFPLRFICQSSTNLTGFWDARLAELVGMTRDFVLARYWLGHARKETTLKYTHIYQQSANTARKKKQKIEFVE